MSGHPGNRTRAEARPRPAANARPVRIRSRWELPAGPEDRRIGLIASQVKHALSKAPGDQPPRPRSRLRPPAVSSMAHRGVGHKRQWRATPCRRLPHHPRMAAAGPAWPMAPPPPAAVLVRVGPNRLESASQDRARATNAGPPDRGTPGNPAVGRQPRHAATPAHGPARAVHRGLRVARTITDLAGEERVSVRALAEAMQYRAYEARRFAAR